jgi:hypothetical protein
MPKTVNLQRRHGTLLKKASELSELCIAEVAVIAFSPDGQLHEYSSTSVEHTLERYKNKVGLVLPSKALSLPEERRREPAEQELQDKHAALCLEILQRKGKQLEGLSLVELSALLEQQTKGLLAVQNKKVEVLKDKLQQSISREEQTKVKLQRCMSREEQTMQENEILRRRFEGFMVRQNYKPHNPSPRHPATLDKNYENRMGFCTSSRAAVSVSNYPSDKINDHLDMITLRLGPP